MRRRALVIAIIVAAILVATPASAGGGRFGAYVSCSSATADHDSVCSLGASPVAIFRAFRRAEVRYEVCVRRPNGKRRCREKRTGRPGRRSRAAIALGQPGLYKVSWWVRGKRIDRDRLRARAPRVFVNGDSLAVGTRPYLPRALPGWPITQSTSISRHAPEGVGILQAQGRGLARIVVMQLGTNDDPRATDAFRQAVRGTMRVVGRDRCVVWPNIVRPAVAGATYAGYNRILALENRRRDNLFVVDWVGIVRHRSFGLSADGVHPDARGYEIRARAIGKKVRRCLD